MGVSNRNSAPVVPPVGTKEWMRVFTNFMQEANKGHIPVTGTVTLTPGANATTVTDSRAGPTSFIGFMPRTAAAAAEWLNIVIAQQGAGLFEISHTNNAIANRTYTYCIMG